MNALFYLSFIYVYKKTLGVLCRAQNNGLSQAIFRPTSTYDRANSNLVGQIYCTFTMGKPMIVCNNVPALKIMTYQLTTIILSTGCVSGCCFVEVCLYFVGRI